MQSIINNFKEDKILKVIKVIKKYKKYWLYSKFNLIKWCQIFIMHNYFRIRHHQVARTLNTCTFKINVIAHWLLKVELH